MSKLDDALKKFVNDALEANYGVRDVEYMHHIPEEIQLEFVKFSYFKKIRSPTEKVKLAAIRHEPWDIEYIENPSEELQLEAVGKNIFSIRYIKNPTEKVQLKAMEKCVEIIADIRNPTITVQKEAIYRSGFHPSIILLCPNWPDLREWIEDNMTIKDIIE